MMRRIACACAAVVLALAPAVSFAPPMRAGSPPGSPCPCGGGPQPAHNSLGCLSSIVGGAPDGFAFVGGQAILSWHVDWQCAPLGDPACEICVKGLVQRFDAGGRGWVIAPGGAEAPQAIGGRCGQPYHTACQTAYPIGLLPPGTNMQTIGVAAALDPSQGDCAAPGQMYTQYAQKFWIMPQP